MAPGTPAAEIPLSGDDERQLIAAAQADPRRFGELYERNFDRVYAFIARRTGDRAAAEDLTSEVFHHALAHLGRFEWRGVPFAAWLLRIARNAVVDRWERMAREQGAPTPASEDGSRDDDVGRRVMLADLVGRLPSDQRRVVLERFVEQKSIREIADTLGRTEGAVKQLQFRALESLRARMRDTHE
jgi:RNA polymerase sigma-70 factor (ECF subfamily)